MFSKIDFALGSPVSNGSNLEISRQKIETVHGGKNFCLGTQNRIFVFHGCREDQDSQNGQ